MVLRNSPRAANHRLQPAQRRRIDILFSREAGMNKPEITRTAGSIARRLLGGLSFILVIIGQMTLFTQPDALAAGLMLSLAGAVLFLWGSVCQPPRGVGAPAGRISLTPF